MFLSLTILITSYSFVGRAALTSQQCSSATNIRVRLPPTINPSVSSDPPQWKPMPSGWYYGDWYVAYSSNEKYAALENLIWSLSPVFPTCGLAPNSTPADCPEGTFPGQLNDLSTWTINNTRKIESAFGYYTPVLAANASADRGWVDTWTTVGAGALSYFQQGFEPMAWGYDHNGNGYILNYELPVLADNTPACMDILSRVAAGPAKTTVNAIHSAVTAMNNTALSELLSQVQRMTFNGKRHGLPAFVCNPDCVNNTADAAGNI